jgi:hypothetical protein
MVHSTPTDNPGPDQHSPLDRLPSTQGKKRNQVISNKNNKDTLQRGWGALSSEVWGRGILPGTVKNKPGPAGEALAGAGAHTQQPGAGKLVRVAERGKPHKREGKTHLPCELQTNASWQEQQHSPAIRIGKACKSGGERNTPQEREEDPLPT